MDSSDSSGYETKDLRIEGVESDEMARGDSNDGATSSKASDEPVAKRSKFVNPEEDGHVDGSESSTSTSDDLPPEWNNSDGMRLFRRIPIFVVDYHNDVLEFIYRCLASRHLPFENNTLLHFDSHPDMVISRDIPASASYDKDTMLTHLSIENWIMPICYTGNFNRVIWVKNSWCNQMPVGKYKFKVGHKDDKMCVDCTLDYFLSEGNYCPTAELEQARDLELQVVNADTENVLNPVELLPAAGDIYYVLDIDLDFFSTTNPFLEIYKQSNCYMQLGEIFCFDSAAGIMPRIKQLETLKEIFAHLEANRSLEGLERPSTEVISEEVMQKIQNLSNTLHEHYVDDEIDWLLLFDSGSTTDTNGLPHHISTEDELELYYTRFKEFLRNLPYPPTMVTIACSAEDDYCPSDQVKNIEDTVVKILLEVFGEKIHKKPILHYKQEQWEVMLL